MGRKFVVVGFMLLVALALQGCMATVPFQPAQVKNDKALVYLYRPESIISRGTHFSVVINGGQEITPLVNNGYIPVYVEPGNVHMVLRENTIPKGTLHKTTFHDLKAGQVYYIKAKPALFGAYTLIRMDEATGQSEVSGALFYKAE